MTNKLQEYPPFPETGYVRLPQILRYFPVSRSMWWQMVKDGRAPSGIKISPRITVWESEAIRQLWDSAKAAEDMS